MQFLVKIIMKLWVPWNLRNLFTSSATVSFPRWNLLHWVCYLRRSYHKLILSACPEYVLYRNLLLRTLCSLQSVYSPIQDDANISDHPILDVMRSIIRNTRQTSQPSHRLPHVIFTISILISNGRPLICEAPSFKPLVYKRAN